MATTIRNATLKVTVKEEITLNGQRQNSENITRISGISNVVKRIVNIGTDEIGLLGFGTAYNTELSKTYLAGQFDEDNVRYIRITNLDDTNHVSLTFKDENASEFAVKLDKGQSFIYNGDLSGGVVDTMHAGGSALTVSLNDLVNITADADTASCDMEIFVACT